MSDTQKILGLTTEGQPFEMTVVFAPGAPSGANPISLFGSYRSADGGGVFRVEQGADGLYYAEGQAEGRKSPEEVLPWVISESEDW